MADTPKVVSLNGKALELPGQTAKRHFERLESFEKLMNERKITAVALVAVDENGMAWVDYAVDTYKLTALIGACHYTAERLSREMDNDVTEEKPEDKQ